MKQFISSLAAIAALIILPAVESSSPFVISDDRVRSLDITPVLGRGYSIMTNTYQSTCLIVDTTTIPSFDYDYLFTEMTSDSSQADIDKLVQGRLSNLLSYDFINEMVSGFTPAGASATGKQKQLLITSMFIERYYASVKEDVNPLSASAITLLQNEDYVGFFKSCGPNYVRGLRRAQEVTATFEFESTSVELAKEFTAAVKSSDTSDSKYEAITETLTIAIRGYGMGVSQEGSETLVATSLSDYFGAMKFAFNSMTKAPNAHHIGMVYGMEVVPWVNNLQFNIYAQITDKEVNIPLSREYIAKAKHTTSGNDDFDPTASDGKEVRSNYACDTSGYLMDKLGLCCSSNDLIIAVRFESGGTEVTDCSGNNLAYCLCSPKASLDKSVVRDNMSNNGEFVARLDSALRYKMAQMGTLEKCISAVGAIPSDKYDNYIQMKDSVKYDQAKQRTFTVKHLKYALDPLGDYGMVTHLGREMDEWIDQFYAPCLNDLYGMNKAEADFSYIMAYPWYTHDSCNKLSCLTNNMAWDSTNGGCMPSLVANPSARFNGSKCKAKADGACVHTVTDGSGNSVNQMDTWATSASSCWTSNSLGGLTYLLDNFCFPKVSNVVSSSPIAGTNCVL